MGRGGIAPCVSGVSGLGVQKVPETRRLGDGECLLLITHSKLSSTASDPKSSWTRNREFGTPPPQPRSSLGVEGFQSLFSPPLPFSLPHRTVWPGWGWGANPHMLLVLRKGGVANEKVCIKGFQIWAKFRTLAQLSRANGGGGETRPQPLLLSCFQTPSGSLGRRLVQRYPGNSHPGPPPGALNTGALLPAQPTVLGIEPHKASDWTLFSRRYTRATAQIAEGGDCK